MSGYHLSETEPRVCTAQPGNCPIGGAHFTTLTEAQEVFSYRATQKFNPFGVFKKKKEDPFTKHKRTAAMRLDELSIDLENRDARQLAGNLQDQLVKEGFSKELIESRTQEEVRPREAGLAYIETLPGDTPVLGLNYNLGTALEERYGAEALVNALEAGTYSSKDVYFYEFEGFTMLTLRGAGQYHLRADATIDPIQHSEEGAMARYGKAIPYELRRRESELSKLTVEQLKRIVKDKATKARTKDELVLAALRQELPETHRDSAIGEFSRGESLTIITKDPLEAKMFERLKKAADDGYLRLGKSSSEYDSGITFYDERDLSRAMKTRNVEQEEAKKNAERYITEAKAHLKEAGGNILAFTPEVTHELEDVRDARYYVKWVPSDRAPIEGVFDKESIEKLARKDFSFLN